MYDATAVISTLFLSSINNSIFISILLRVFLSIFDVLIERTICTVSFGHGCKFISSVAIISKL